METRRIRFGHTLAISLAVVTLLSACASSDSSSPSQTTTTTTDMTSDSTTTPVDDSTTSTTAVTGPIGPNGYTLVGLEYYSIPVLGATDVRGSGCGSGIGDDPTLPDVLPDGIWFGSLGPKYEYYEPTSPEDLGFGYARLYDDHLEIDLWCVYGGQTAETKYNDPSCSEDTGCPSNNASWWFTEDQSNKLRSVALSADYLYTAEPETGDPYFRGCSTSEIYVSNAAWRNWPVWIAVNGGQVTEVLGICSYYTLLRGL
jgi:hypothetical protein